MRIVDAQIHLWGNGLPSNMAHRQVTSFTTEEASRCRASCRLVVPDRSGAELVPNAAGPPRITRTCRHTGGPSVCSARMDALGPAELAPERDS